VVADQVAIDFLVQDKAGIRRYSLNRQVEALLIDIDAVVVDRSADALGRAGFQRTQNQETTDGRQTDHCAARCIRDTHDVETSATVLEELLHSGSETAALPKAAEATVKLGNACNQYRSVEGASEGTAYKSSRGFIGHADGAIHRRYFGDRDATV
jgi:hypothetical protein